MPSALDRLEALSRPPPTAPGGPAHKKGLGAVLVAVLGFVLLKGKWAALLLLGKLKLVGLVGLKLLQFFPTVWTMVLSIWVYSAYQGWGLAGLLVGLILVHELGHAAAARHLGIDVGVPVFIPFVGAFIALKERTTSSTQRFVIAAGGPL